MPNDPVYRCSDGHLYTASWAKTVLLSIHLGLNTKFQRCPVDGHWRRATRVNPNDLTDQQLQEAERHSF